MHPHLLITFLSLTIFVTASMSRGDENEQYPICAPTKFNCGGIDKITYPFWIEGRPEICSYPGFKLTCNDNSLEIAMHSKTYRIKAIDYSNQRLTIVDTDIIGKNCPQLPSSNSTLDFDLFSYARHDLNLTLYYNCPYPIPNTSLRLLRCLTNGGNHAYYMIQEGPLFLSPLFGDCMVSFVSLLGSAVGSLRDDLSNFGDVMDEGFNVSWVVDDGFCTRCVRSRGNCGYNPDARNDPVCYCRDQAYYYPAICPALTSASKTRKPIKIAIGLSAGIGGFLIACISTYIWYRRKRLASSSLTLLSRTISSDPSSKSELGNCCSMLPTHVFSYKELEEATNNFDPSKELGEGGFGTVYYGKLHDGRSVAVKRLYENNYKRVEQFMNEIDILSRLRHQNLVSLYGCTSRHSRELLLVYEFIPNGTVADHIHGERAKAGALTWPIRMSVAIETADALSYLHAVDIIHRDVKTNNILLDNDFHVKVADFGLSRLFPIDKTHVSTAPQGTPGYVDPDYHRCYQLNDKSDVYSFGVVLFELISSKPAVDITRHRQEINLFNMAINKIHNNALHELVDPSFGFESDNAVRRMITSVAELAYRCLHDEKDMRPSMGEVLKILRGIENDKYKVDKPEEFDVLADDVVLLKKISPPSPDSVAAPWISRNTTPNASG